MDTATMNISLPRALKQFVKKRVGEKQYANPSDYVRSLIREDQVRQEEERLGQMLLEGLRSGEPIPMTNEAWKRLRTDVHEGLKNSKRGV